MCLLQWTRKTTNSAVKPADYRWVWVLAKCLAVALHSTPSWTTVSDKFDNEETRRDDTHCWQSNHTKPIKTKWHKTPCGSKPLKKAIRKGHTQSSKTAREKNEKRKRQSPLTAAHRSWPNGCGNVYNCRCAHQVGSNIVDPCFSLSLSSFVLFFSLSLLQQQQLVTPIQLQSFLLWNQDLSRIHLQFSVHHPWQKKSTSSLTTGASSPATIATKNNGFQLMRGLQPRLHGSGSSTHSSKAGYVPTALPAPQPQMQENF